MDYTNSQEFGDNLIEQTLSTLRDQEDAQALQLQRGSVVFNPSVFRPTDPVNPVNRTFDEFNPGDKRTVVLGPFKFDRRFAEQPSISFGEIQQFVQSPTQSGVVFGTPSNYVPFMVKPEVFQWTFANGEVDGFYLSLYALSKPPLGVITHCVTWIAVGKGSRYTETSTEQSWQSSWDYNTASYLENSDDADFEE